MTVDRLSAIYLRNHEAAAAAGVQLFGRVARARRGRAHGELIARLAEEVGTDLAMLRSLMADLGVRRAPVLARVVRAAEATARLKPNGTLLRRSPLSDLIEAEALLDAVNAKAAGWAALRSASWADERRPGVAERLRQLGDRAEEQLAELRRVHAETAAAVLVGPAEDGRPAPAGPTA